MTSLNCGRERITVMPAQLDAESGLWYVFCPVCELSIESARRLPNFCPDCGCAFVFEDYVPSDVDEDDDPSDVEACPAATGPGEGEVKSP
ncbi:MAG TPA: hypothetical protein PLA31_01285 [Clostridia bacterium]|nr:hypothetical protein [Clostridia bacterium]HQO55017.1 hypothetical protein [Clostridia bacterium]HUM60067.1 hypothetical protein [Clostridia bacterium]